MGVRVRFINAKELCLFFMQKSHDRQHLESKLRLKQLRIKVRPKTRPIYALGRVLGLFSNFNNFFS